MTIVDDIAEKIHRRRRQILLHAVIYYKFDDTYVPDHVYDKWAKELISLQRNHPHISELVAYQREAFNKFVGSVTSFDLPLDDVKANSLARQMLAYREKKKNLELAA